MKNEKQKEKIIIECLKKINPKLIKIINNDKYNLITDNHLDSFDVMNLLIEIEKKTKKKINSKYITEKDFKNIETIKKII
jgi:acyl carrier protein